MAPGGEPSGATVSACFRRARSTGRPAVSPGDVCPVSHVRPLPYALVYTGTAGSGGGAEVPGSQSGAKGRDQEAGRGLRTCWVQAEGPNDRVPGGVQRSR